MDSRKFFDRVKAMRYFQKQYFKTRSRTALQQSKALEKEIDDEIARVNKALGLPEYSVPETPNIFGR